MLPAETDSSSESHALPGNENAGGPDQLLPAEGERKIIRTNVSVLCSVSCGVLLGFTVRRLYCLFHTKQ